MREAFPFVFGVDFGDWPTPVHSDDSPTGHANCFSACSSREKMDSGDKRLISNSSSIAVSTPGDDIVLTEYDGVLFVIEEESP